MLEPNERLPSETVPFGTVQIIAGALILGPLGFGAMSYFLTRGQKPGDPTLAYLTAGFAVIAIFASLVASTISGNQKLRMLRADGGDISSADLFAVFQTRVIVRASMLEGAALFCCIGYMTSRLWWSLGTVLVLIGMMLVLFPTRGGFDQWAHDQRELRTLDGRSSSSGRT